VRDAAGLHARWLGRLKRLRVGLSGSERPRARSRGGGCGLLEVWAQSENRPEQRERETIKRKRVFQILKSKQPNEFEHNFEFKHSKTMHQHVCNIKLL
jgi:hypothetical protein